MNLRRVGISARRVGLSAYRAHRDLRAKRWPGMALSAVSQTWTVPEPMTHHHHVHDVVHAALVFLSLTLL